MTLKQNAREAVVAELRRQHNEDRHDAPFFGSEICLGAHCLDGWFDLDKIAGAVLKSLRPTLPDLLRDLVSLAEGDSGATRRGYTETTEAARALACDLDTFDAPRSPLPPPEGAGVVLDDLPAPKPKGKVVSRGKRRRR